MRSVRVFLNVERFAPLLVVATLACSRGVAVTTSTPPLAAPTSSPTSVTQVDVRRLLSALADDSMQGRGTATPGSARAAKFIAAELERYGVQPAGDSGFYQRVPVAFTPGNGRRG